MSAKMVVERKKNKKRKDDGSGVPAGSEKPSKEEYAVAKWIRNNVPSKKTKFNRKYIVEYFTGSRAVDALMEKSPWKDTLFENRQSVVYFLDSMLRHEFFHRAKKIIITEDELIRYKGLKKKPKEVKDSKDKKKDTEGEKSGDKSSGEKSTDEKKSNSEEAESKKKKDEPKKKSKVRLEMHKDQYFEDCNDAYVWVYEPIPVYYWFFGTLLVLGAIGVCLFPLWPLTVRHGVWYLSIVAAGFLVFVLSLIVVRVIVFSLIWILTIGRHHLWLLPNLLEDVGFFASFWPLYHYKYYGASDSDKDNAKEHKQSKKKEKDSDAEDDGHNEPEESDSSVHKKSEKIKDAQSKEKHDSSGEESGSEKSNMGDFEML